MAYGIQSLDVTFPTDARIVHVMSGAPTTLGSTSSSLLRRIQANEPTAWLRFTELYGPLVYHWVREAGLQPADTADIVQEAFRAVATGIHGFEPTDGGRFRGWLRTIALNKVRDYFRRQYHEPTAQGGTDAHEKWEEVPDASSEHQPATGTQHLVRSVLAQIEVEFESLTWRAFWRTTIDEQRPADIAAELGISVASVYQAKSRVLRRLRDELTDCL